jgi:serine/threonine-protein kinase RsbW
VTSQAEADVSLVVPAVPDSIAVIRQTVSGICEALGADSRTVGDIKLAATEACTNVVLHAYADADEAGTIEIDAYAAEDELRLLVRDHGAGMTPAPLAEGLGLGLPLIAALTSSLTIVEPDDGGTEISMTFSLREATPEP